MAKILSDEDLASLPVTVYQRDGRTFAVIHELYAVAEGNNAEEAITHVRSDVEARRALFEHAAARISISNGNRVMSFCIKTAAVVLAFVVVIVTADIVAQRTLADLPRRLAATGFATIDEIGQLSQWISDERKRELGRSVRTLLENLGPLIDEIRPALVGNQGSGRMNGEPGQ